MFNFYIMKKKYSLMTATKKSVIWFTFSSIIQNGILFFSTPIYTRMLTNYEYGIYSVFQSWLQIVSIISILALDRCVTIGFMKFSKQKREFLSSIQTLITLLIFICSIVVFVFSDFFETLIQLPTFLIITMLLVSLMNSTLSNWSWFQRYNFEYKKLTIVTIGTTFLIQLIAVIAILVIPAENKAIVLIIAMSGSRLFMYGFIYFSILFRGKSKLHKDFWRFGLTFSIAVIPHALSQIILSSSDRIMIDKFCGKIETAYYSVIYSAAMVLNTIIVSVSSAIQPWYFEKIKIGDYDNLKSATNLLLLFSAVLSISVSLFAPEILAIMAPPEYSKAIWVFPSIAASVYFNCMYLCFANFESYYEKPIYSSVATTIGAILNIVLNFIFIPIFGFVAAGYTTLLSYILFAVLHYMFMRKVCSEFIGTKKIFSVKYFLVLSFVLLAIIFGITYLYNYLYIRYVLILLVIVVILL